MPRRTRRRWIAAIVVPMAFTAASLLGAEANSKAEETPSSIAGTDLARMLRRDTHNLMMRKSPRGAMTVDIDGGFQSVLIVQIGHDGKPVISCIASEKEAERIFAPKKETAREKP